MYTQKESEPRQIVSDKLCQTNCVRQTVSMSAMETRKTHHFGETVKQMHFFIKVKL